MSDANPSLLHDVVDLFAYGRAVSWNNSARVAHTALVIPKTARTRKWIERLFNYDNGELLGFAHWCLRGDHDFDTKFFLLETDLHGILEYACKELGSRLVGECLGRWMATQRDDFVLGMSLSVRIGTFVHSSLPRVFVTTFSETLLKSATEVRHLKEALGGPGLLLSVAKVSHPVHFPMAFPDQAVAKVFARELNAGNGPSNQSGVAPLDRFFRLLGHAVIDDEHLLLRMSAACFDQNADESEDEDESEEDEDEGEDEDEDEGGAAGRAAKRSSSDMGAGGGQKKRVGRVDVDSSLEDREDIPAALHGALLNIVTASEPRCAGARITKAVWYDDKKDLAFCTLAHVAREQGVFFTSAKAVISKTPPTVNVTCAAGVRSKITDWKPVAPALHVALFNQAPATASTATPKFEPKNTTQLLAAINKAVNILGEDKDEDDSDEEEDPRTATATDVLFYMDRLCKGRSLSLSARLFNETFGVQSTSGAPVHISMQLFCGNTGAERVLCGAFYTLKRATVDRNMVAFRPFPCADEHVFKPVRVLINTPSCKKAVFKWYKAEGTTSKMYIAELQKTSDGFHLTVCYEDED